jgi:hypothetical protein
MSRRKSERRKAETQCRGRWQSARPDDYLVASPSNAVPRAKGGGLCWRNVVTTSITRFAIAVTLTPGPSPAKEKARERGDLWMPTPRGDAFGEKGRERGDRLTRRECLMPASIETSGQIAICPYMAVVISSRAEPYRSRKTENRKPRPTVTP